MDNSARLRRTITSQDKIVIPAKAGTQTFEHKGKERLVGVCLHETRDEYPESFFVLYASGFRFRGNDSLA